MTAGTAGNQPGGGRRALLPHRKVFFLVQGLDKGMIFFGS